MVKMDKLVAATRKYRDISKKRKSGPQSGRKK